MRGTLTLIWPHASLIARLVIAVVLTFVVIRLLFSATHDVTGPLTALLVVQASSVGTVRAGILRIGAVLTGVLIALGMATFVGLTWWSLALVVAAALLVATVLRLGDQLLEAPISAMLILGASASETAAQDRLLFTLVGAAVGAAMGLALPPSLPISLASSRLRQVADQLAEQLSTAGEMLAAQPVARAQVDDWIQQLRHVDKQVDSAAETIDQVSEGRRLNTRALTVADVGPLMRSALETLENCALSVRALFVHIRTEVTDSPTEHASDDDLRAVFAVVLHHSSSAIRSFGELAEAEVEGRQGEAESSFAVSLEMLREGRAVLTELMLTDADDQSWLMRSSTLSALEQVLAQLNLESRSQVRAEWETAQANRLGAHLPVLIRDALPQPEGPLPKLVERGLKEVVSLDRGARLVRGSRRALRKGRNLVDSATLRSRPPERPDGNGAPAEQPTASDGQRRDDPGAGHDPD